jgi:site-specific DNA recombinase
MKTEIIYAAYLRKSTDDKEKQLLSLERQEDTIQTLEDRHGIKVAFTFSEKKSAKIPGRPEFNKLMKLIEQKKIQGIVCWQTHRLSRNAVDSGTLVDLMDKKLLQKVITESQVFSSENTMDKFMLTFSGAQAKLENDNRAKDVSAGMAKVAKNGVYPVKPPIGYLPDKHGIKGARKRVIDPIRFPIVRKMWDMLLTGCYPVSDILEKATTEWGLRNELGGRIAKSNLYKVFENTFYYGDFEWPRGSGNWITGIHQPMITKEEYEKAQDILGNRSRPRPKNHFFAFAGCTMKCGECGCSIVGQRKTKHQKNGNTHIYTYYGCSKRKNIPCSQKPVKEDDLEAHITDLLQAIHIPEQLHTFMMEVIREENKNQFKEIYAIQEAQNGALGHVLKRIDGLIDMRASGLLTNEKYTEKASLLEKEKDELEQQIKNQNKLTNEWIEAAETLLTFSDIAEKRFKEGSDEVKRAILSSLGWNLSLKDKKLDFTMVKWILPMKNLASYLKQDNSWLEPKNVFNYKDILGNLTEKSLLCAREDLNLHALMGATTSR